MADTVIKWYGRQVFTEATKVNVETMKEAAFYLERDIKTHFTLQGSGREYRRGEKIHKASAPGEPPAIDYGILRSSIMSDVLVDGPQIVGRVGPDIEKTAQHPTAITVGAGPEYGYYLEIGTPKMKARPYLRPALARTHNAIEKMFKRANGK